MPESTREWYARRHLEDQRTIMELRTKLANKMDGFTVDEHYVSNLMNNVYEQELRCKEELIRRDYVQLQREHLALLNALQSLYDVQGIKYVWSGKLVERVALSIYPVIKRNPVEETREEKDVQN
jgi:hypothetical protein